MFYCLFVFFISFLFCFFLFFVFCFFRSFVVLHETLHFNKFKGADFKYDNIFFQIPVQKHPNNKAFLVPNWSFFYMTLYILTNEKVLISNIRIVLSNFGLKRTIKAFLVQSSKFFLHETLHFGKFEGADCKYSNSFFKFQSKKVPNKENLVSR